MRFRAVCRIVFVKEFRELLRDRRSLLWLFAPPILLPGIILCAALFVGSQTVRIAREGFPVLIENGDQAPELVRRFEAASTIHVLEAPPHPEQDPFGRAILIVSLCEDFQKQLAETGTVTIELLTRDNSIITVLGRSAVRDIIEAYSDDLLEARLRAQGLSREWLRPIQVSEGRRASSGSVAVVHEQQGSSGFLTTLFLPLAVTSWLLGGGMGLILDTTVGEKERQTIENLLVTPASRAGIVVGKMAVVFIASLAVMGLWLAEGLLLNALSAAGPALMEAGSRGSDEALDLLINSSQDVLGLIVILLLLVVPFTILLNSLVMAWCTFAANYREANLFMALLQLGLPASVLLTVFSMPARVGAHVYAMPFLGAIVAIRDLFGSTLSPGGLVISLFSGLVYAVASIGLVTWMFDREWSLTRGL